MNRLARRLLYILVAIAATLAIGTVGFTLIDHYPPFDAFYMTLTTMTTVGYAEVHPLSRAGRIFNSFLIFFGLVGYLMKKFKYEPAPSILALVLTPMFENALRQSLIISRGNPLIFVTRPISLSFLLIALCMLVLPIFAFIRKRRAAIIG